MTAAPSPGPADFAAAGARSATFADAARVAARLAATLGWSPAAFWASTPADLRLALGLDLPGDARRARRRRRPCPPEGGLPRWTNSIIW